MKRGLLFDLDGTLANTLPWLRETYRRFLSIHGIIDSDEEFETINGPSLDQVVSILKNKHQLTKPVSELFALYIGLLGEGYLHTEPNPGALEVLTFAVDRGWICGIVTSNSERLTLEWLVKNQLRRVISGVIGRESFHLAKPDPEPYLVALKRLQCDAKISIAVEDSVAGITSASKANIRTIAFVPLNVEKTDFSVECIHNLLELKPWLIYA